MKILILVIYSESEFYKDMLEIQRSYIHLNPNFQVFFIQSRIQSREEQTKEEEVEIQDDFIYVKSLENKMGILGKTLKSLEYLIQKGLVYDFIVRTNISTLINLDLLYNHLTNIPTENIYTGGFILNLQWLDPEAGIIDETFFGTKFLQGTSIILSWDIVNKLVNNLNKIRYDIIDDVSIAIFIKQYATEAYKNSSKYMCSFMYFNSRLCKLSDARDRIFIRNKDERNRENDVKNMNKLVEYLQLKNIN